MAYTIMINEWQRQLIMEALTSLRPLGGSNLPDPRDTPEWGLCGTDGSKEQEHANLVKMIGLLPSDEEKDPGTCHGLCL